MSEYRQSLINLIDRRVCHGDRRRVISGAEIGIHRGRTSAELLRAFPGLTLYMVDSWAVHDANEAYFHSRDPMARYTQEQQDRFKADALQTVAPFGKRAVILQTTSRDAAEWTPDESLDLAFLDGDHSTAGCAADLELWWPKMKPGGLFAGHDFGKPEYGVTQAVDEWAARTGVTISVEKGHIWWTLKPS